MLTSWLHDRGLRLCFEHRAAKVLASTLLSLSMKQLIEGSYVKTLVLLVRMKRCLVL